MASQLMTLARRLGTRRAPSEPPKVETVKDRGDAINNWYSSRYGDGNPDAVVQKAGDYSPYKKMRYDPTVSAAIAYLTYHAITESGNVDCGDQAIVDFCEDNIQNHMARKFDVIFRDMTHWAIVCGNVGGEMVWEQDAGEWWWADLRLKDPDYIEYDCTDTGKVRNILFRQNGTGTATPLPNPYNFPILRFNEGLSNPYGESLLRPAYHIYLGRVAQLKNLLLHGERTAFPTIIGWYPANSQLQDQTDFLAAIKQLSRKVVAILREGMRIQTMEAGQINPAMFIDPLEYMAREIYQAICGGYLMIAEGGSSTSYNAGMMHESNVDERVKAIRAAVEDCINRSILFQIARYKFGYARTIANPPKYRFTPRPDKNLLEWAQAQHVLKQIGVDVPISHFIMKCDLPEGTKMLTTPEMIDHALVGSGETNDGRISVNQKIRDDTKNISKIDRSAGAKGM
ncbi:MAG: DUF935 family protein [Deltaproteobacteria bacterium]|nr:DUF935 family protein [Deltaproteobacteria bacterium]